MKITQSCRKQRKTQPRFVFARLRSEAPTFELPNAS